MGDSKKYRLFFFLFFAFVFLVQAEGSLCADPSFIVKVFSTYQSYNSYYPWEKNKFNSRTAFGTLLQGEYILTTADTISDHTQIELKKTTDDKKYPAEVAYVDYSCNIALLKAEDKDFYKGLSPVELANGLKKTDKIRLVQIKNNNEIYYKEGSVEEVSVEQSYLGWDEYLSYLISIKLEDRSHWAEPVMKKGQLAGIVTSYDSNRFLAETIPVELIRHFLEDIADGKYDGFPDPGFYWESLANPSFKKYLGMSDDMTGVYIARIIPGSSAENFLEKGDVLLSLGGQSIDNKGYISSLNHGKLKLSILFTSSFPGRNLKAEVFRKGKRVMGDIPLKRFTSENYLIPLYQFDQQPRYIIEGGFIIQELTTSYLKTWGQEWQNSADKRLLYYYNYFSRSSLEEKEKLVILSFVLPDDINIGYQNFRQLIIQSVNGKIVKNIQDVAEAFHNEEVKDVLLVFDGKKQAVFRKEDLKTANERIANRYRIF